MERRFLSFVRRKQLVREGDRVLVAVSGGLDSMVLLHLFHSLAAPLRISIVGAHFDHAMRERSADDAAWLAGLCQAWNVELLSARTERALYGESAARNARYAFLHDAAARANANRIATAHHADDQIETVLFRMLRGTGLRGLAGIPIRRGLLIRPLLRFRKTQLEAYAAAHSIPFREDESNATDAYARNRIRRAVIPALQTVVPNGPAGILAVARHAARAEKSWHSLLQDVRRSVVVRRDGDSVELARGILLEYDAETRARLLRGELRRLGVAADKTLTRSLLRFSERGRSGSALPITHTMRLERAYEVLRLTHVKPLDDAAVAIIPGCEQGSAHAMLGGRQWHVHWSTSPAAGADSASFDCAALHFPLQVRAWRPGDRMRLHYGSKKLKKIFAEARVPVHERASVPVLADATGRVYWVAGVLRSIDAPPRENHSAIAITIGHAEIS